MRRGTTTKKQQNYKEFRAAVPGIRTTLIVGYPENSGRFQYLERFCSRNEMNVTYPRRKIHAYLQDDVPDTVKQDRANEIMELQSQISWDLNQKSRDKHLNALLTEKKALIL
jgi:ribosomal protein S12 methylthiotransferase